MTRWHRLNAYVDGELAPEEADVLRAEAAQDPDLEARIATLSRLKVGVVQARATAQRPATVAGRLLRRVALTAAAAGAVAIAVLCVQRVPPQDPMAAAVALYRHWPAPDDAALPRDPPGAPLRVMAPPDLGPAHLRIVFAAATGGPEGMLFGYEGIHGCRVALWVARAENPSAGGALAAPSDVQVVRWSSGRKSFALLARGMDETRLERLAAAVERLTRERDPGGARIALGESAEGGRPCAG